MLKRLIKRAFRLLLPLAVIAGLVLGIPRLITAIYAATHSYSPDRAPTKRVAVVFGAGLYRDGTPTAVLRDRIETAAQLYFAGKVEKLLMSGDNRFIYYNEPESMRSYAVSLGIPDKDIVLDYAGRRTYDTCYRARDIFGVTDAILVTQGWHLPRALFTCNMLGLQAIGVPSDGPRHYSRRLLVYWSARELPATLEAFFEVLVWKPFPVLGNKEPIFKENY